MTSEAVNDTLKAIAASLLMEQVLAPRFEFRPKTRTTEATPEASIMVRTATIRASATSGFQPEGQGAFNSR